MRAAGEPSAEGYRESLGKLPKRGRDVNDLLRRLVQGEGRHDLREWTMKNLERLGEEEA